MNRISLAALFAATALATPAFAQEQAPEAEPETGGWTPGNITVTGSRGSYTADEASVTRTPVPLIEVPQSIQVITAELIKDQELVTLDEALRNVSGVVPSLPSEIVLVNPIVRGFEAEIFTDGLIGYGDTAVIDPGSLWNVERIEVAKGPTSTLFGGGIGSPVGGLINLVSKTANGTSFLDTRVRAGSFKTYSIAADAGVALTDSLSARVVTEYQSSDDNIEVVDIERLLIAPSVRFAPSENTEIVGRFTYTRIAQLEYAGLPAIFVDDPRVDPERFTGATNAPETEVENLTAQLEWTQRLGEGLTFNLRGRRYENDFREFATSPFLAFFPCGAASGLNATSCPQIRAQLPASIDEWTVDGSLTAEFTTGAIEHVVLGGVQWDRADYDAAIGFDLFNVEAFDYADPASDFDFFPVPALSGFNTNRYETLAAYVQDQLTIADRLHVLASLRYSRLGLTEFVGGAGNDEVYHEWDPRVGLTFDVTDGVSLFAGYATGSRLSIFFNGTTSPVPERSESWEGGVKFALGDTGLSGTIAAFRLDRTNVPTPDPGTFFTSIQTGAQRSEGIEADFIYEPSPAFSLLASYGYSDARVTADTVIPVGSRLPRVADHRGRIAARYRFLDGGMKGLELGAGLTAASDSVIALPNGAEVDGYVVADAQASYTIDGMRVGLRIDNLFGADYFVPYQYFAQDVVRPGNPRSAFVTLGFEL
ncbi:TonB-dependent siderophore receptor [Erythrobacter sp. BLCC-B19]|uniref:TonB-dependent siderophore receptor n=1 Tax=Erythrobacter sp. BLCC-B19 TaxID=3025315 RepID=UPI002362A439|nr:TonB-dependent siderophore receptor [Erythrobacter sp. BLCC-B19]WDA41380.1 TonB-dependent siderophore receptor [Erythrobacter sp. BLCC-B19]